MSVLRLAAGDGVPLRHDLPGAEHARVAPPHEVVDQHAARRPQQGAARRRRGHVRVARRPLHPLRQEEVSGAYVTLCKKYF